LEDIAISTGATFVTRLSGKKAKDVKLADLGSSTKVEIVKNATMIMGGNGDISLIDERVESLKSQLEATDGIQECERIQNRITKMASGVAVIRVGGVTEVEMIEKRHRIEDALEAVRSAQQEGIVPGGGTALIRASILAKEAGVDTDNEEQTLGVEIVMNAVQAPLRQMALNAGASGDIIVSKILDTDTTSGYDFSSGEFVDLLNSGILDPAKVARCSLQNSASAAGTLITANFAIVQS
jgi:chaperonin GroEL